MSENFEFSIGADKESIDNFVKSALEQATDEERDNVAKAVLGDKAFEEWKRRQRPTCDRSLAAVDEAVMRWVQSNINNKG